MLGPVTIDGVQFHGDISAFAKAFIAAQTATDAVKKAAANPFFNSRYADLATVVEAVIPAMNAAGVGVLQFPSFDGEMVRITTALLHDSGACITSTLAMRPTKNDPQGVGSAITYARRYALLAMTGAAPEDDDGNAASAPQKHATPPPTPKAVVTDMLERSLAQHEPRKSAAQAKRDGDDAKIKAEIGACDLDGLADWEAEFERNTAHVPLSWADPIRDMIEMRREELQAGPAEGEAEMDDAYDATVGRFPGDSHAPMAHRNGGA